MKKDKFEIRPCPVTRAYLEKTDFYTRIDEEWQRGERKRKLLEAARRDTAKEDCSDSENGGIVQSEIPG